MESGSMHEWRRGQEDQYFARRERAARLRAVAAEEQERRALAQVLGFDDGPLAKRIWDLGFDALSAPALVMVPALEVAWAGDAVTGAERLAVERAARRSGIAAGSTADIQLAAWLDERPNRDWCLRARAALSDLLQALPRRDADALWRQVRTACDDVANASGGILGFGNRTSREERDLLTDIERQVFADRLQG